MIKTHFDIREKCDNSKHNENEACSKLMFPNCQKFKILFLKKNQDFNLSIKITRV